MGWGGFEVNKLYETPNIKNVCMHTWTTEDFHFLTVLDKKQRQKFKVSGHYRVQLTSSPLLFALRLQEWSGLARKLPPAGTPSWGWGCGAYIVTSL